MTLIGYHASHEQFPPSELLRLVSDAEQAGFGCAKSSDHFHPWSERQGQSGFAWSWLGAAMQATNFDFGIISAPGYRYHPAVLAQAAATIGEMFPGRLWLSLGTGEAINEAITGEYWPEKAERNARLRECVDIFRALFDGETVTHRGRVTVVEAKLYSRPPHPVPIYGAAGLRRRLHSVQHGLMVFSRREVTSKPSEVLSMPSATMAAKANRFISSTRCHGRPKGSRRSKKLSINGARPRSEATRRGTSAGLVTSTPWEKW